MYRKDRMKLKASKKFKRFTKESIDGMRFCLYYPSDKLPYYLKEELNKINEENIYKGLFVYCRVRAFSYEYRETLLSASLAVSLYPELPDTDLDYYKSFDLQYIKDGFTSVYAVFNKCLAWIDGFMKCKALHLVDDEDDESELEVNDNTD